MTNTTIRSGGRPPTNQLAAITYNPIVGGTADHPTEFPIGTPVAPSQTEDGAVVPGRANSDGTSFVVGVAASRAVVGGEVLVQLGGPVHLTTEQWDAVTGGSGGLVSGARYFLSAAAEGRITTTAPSADGQFVVPIGVALSSTDLLIKSATPVAVSGEAIDPSNTIMFGFTGGTGGGGTEYASPIAAGSAIPFIHHNVVGTAITTQGTTGFVVHLDGAYEISWAIAFDEASQVQLSVSGAVSGPVVHTCASSAAGAQNTNSVILSLSAGDVVSLINPAGNGTSLTVRTAAGALTNAQAPNLCVKLMALDVP